MICKIQKIIRISVIASVLLLYGGEAHAFGFPMFFKTYLADLMRTYATTQMAKAQTSMEHNNMKLVEESIERGNFLEVALIYEMVGSADWDEFGNDPFGYVSKAAEKALKKEANTYISMQRKKGEEYLKKQLSSDDKDKDKDKNKDQETETPTSGDIDLGLGNVSEQAAQKRRDEKYKAQVFKWYKNTRTMATHATSGNVDGLAGDIADIIDESSQKSDDNPSTDK